MLILALSGGAFDAVTYGQAGVVLWACLALAFALGRFPLARPAPAVRRMLMAFAAFAAWSALSLFWTDSAERTAQDLSRLALLGGLLVLTAFGVHRGTWRSVADGLAAAAFVVCAVAVVSRVAPSVFPNAEINSSFGGGRLAYPIEYWNALAGVAAFAVASGVAYGAWAKRREVRSLASAAVPVGVLTLYLTYSRAGIAAALLSLLLLAVLAGETRRALARPAAAGFVASAVLIALTETQPEIAEGTGGSGGLIILLALLIACATCAGLAARGSKRRTRRSSRSRRSPRARAQGRLVAAAGCGALVLVMGVALVADRSGSLARPEAAGQPDDLSSRLASFDTRRGDLWMAAASAGVSNPLGGVGAGTFEMAASADADVLDPADDAHSILLEAFAELGFPGLILMSFLIAALCRLAWQATRSVSPRERAAEATLLTALTILLVQAFVDWTWEVGALAAIGFVGAVALGARESEPLSRRVTTRTRNLGLAGCALAAITLIPSLVSAERLSQSQRALAAGLRSQALDRADDAFTAAPWSASAQNQIARSQLAAGNLEEASAAARRARELEPGYWEHTALAAQVAATAGDLTAARELLGEVAEERPAIAELAEALAADPAVIVAPQTESAP